MEIEITGKLHMPIDPPYQMENGRKCQRIIVVINYDDPRYKTDYFAVFLYGDSIEQFWQDYDFMNPAPLLTIRAKLNGRMKNERNTLTLSYKNHKWKLEK